MITFSWRQAAVFIATGIVVCLLLSYSGMQEKLIGWIDRGVEKVTR